MRKKILFTGRVAVFTLLFIFVLAGCGDAEKVLESISVTDKPKKIMYLLGDSFDPEGMVVTANYSDGSSKKIIDYTISGFTSDKPGKKLITVSYESKTDSFNVSVSDPFRNISAAELVEDVKIGWNLGNTLDAHRAEWVGSDISVADMETGWFRPITTKENITALKNAGFNAIRIPVTWYKAADAEYNIRSDWMARVKEVVNYAIDNEMYVFLNTHHDEDIFKFMNSTAEESKKAFKKIWGQIADAFKDYNERLVFEALNEPRTKSSSMEWNGGTPEEHANLNAHYQIFVDTVRASGGNNNRRIIMVNTYAASSTDRAVNALVIPDDTIEDRIIVSIHAYEPYNFALNESTGYVTTWSKNTPSDTSNIINLLNRARNKFIDNGFPVIMGESGAMRRNITDENELAAHEVTRAEWAEFYVGSARERGIKFFWWDDGGNFRLFNRGDNTFYYPLIYAGLMRGAGVIE